MQIGVCGQGQLEVPNVPSKKVGLRPRVLVVDDDEAVRDSFALALSDLECELVSASNGAEALDYVARNQVHLVFLDLRMPGMNGVVTLRALRLLRPEAKVCIVSAFTDEHMSALIDLASDNLDFEAFRKPLDIDEIRILTLELMKSLRSALPRVRNVISISRRLAHKLGARKSPGRKPRLLN